MPDSLTLAQYHFVLSLLSSLLVLPLEFCFFVTSKRKHLQDSHLFAAWVGVVLRINPQNPVVITIEKQIIFNSLQRIFYTPTLFYNIVKHFGFYVTYFLLQFIIFVGKCNDLVKLFVGENGII